MPVGDHRPAICQQGVIRVHDALWRAGSARGEGEIDDLVGVVVGRRGIEGEPAAGKRRHVARAVRERIDAPQRRQGCRGGKDVGDARIGPVAGLGKKGRGADPRQQRDDLADRVVLVQRRIADVAVARAGEQDRHGLDPVRQPDRNPLAAFDAGLFEIGGNRVDQRTELAPVEPPLPIAHRESRGPLRRPITQQRIERITPPQPLGIIPPCHPGVVQGQNRVGHSAALQSAATAYCGPARIEAGWPGSLMRCAVSVSLLPSTRNTHRSWSIKLPT